MNAEDRAALDRCHAFAVAGDRPHRQVKEIAKAIAGVVGTAYRPAELADLHDDLWNLGDAVGKRLTRHQIKEYVIHGELPSDDQHRAA